MSSPIQSLIGLGTACNGILSLAILMPATSSAAARGVVALFAALQLMWGWAWCRRPWPSRWVSLAFVVSADIGIAVVATVEASWLLGLFGFNAFSMISVYLMFFDGPRVLAAHLAWILLATTVFAIRASAEANVDTVLFTASTLTAVAPVVTTALGIQLGIWALRNDANESTTDPLTGLLNRRGLHLHVADLFRDTACRTEVAVVVVDLDRFKEINDTFGHTVGDQVLVRSARRIKSAVRVALWLRVRAVRNSSSSISLNQSRTRGRSSIAYDGPSQHRLDLRCGPVSESPTLTWPGSPQQTLMPLCCWTP